MCIYLVQWVCFKWYTDENFISFILTASYGTEFVFGFMDLKSYLSRDTATDPTLSLHIKTVTPSTRLDLSVPDTSSSASKTPVMVSNNYFVSRMKEIAVNSSFINRYSFKVKRIQCFLLMIEKRSLEYGKYLGCLNVKTHFSNSETEPGDFACEASLLTSWRFCTKIQHINIAKELNITSSLSVPFRKMFKTRKLLTEYI